MLLEEKCTIFSTKYLFHKMLATVHELCAYHNRLFSEIKICIQFILSLHTLKSKPRRLQTIGPRSNDKYHAWRYLRKGSSVGRPYNLPQDSYSEYIWWLNITLLDQMPLDALRFWDVITFAGCSR